jgi:nucleotide-binding universal stress UspA family protein
MRVLFATDGLPPAIDAQNLLERFVDRDRTEMTVIAVTHAGFPSPKHLALVLDPMDSRRTQTSKIVEAAVEKLSAAGFSVDGQTAEGHPAEEILRTIEHGRFDLAVVGAGTKTWLGQRLLGSVSTAVLHGSPSSVLVSREQKSADDKPQILIANDGSEGAELASQMVTQLADPARCKICVFSVFQDRGPEPTALDELTEQVDAEMKDSAAGSSEGMTKALESAGFETDVVTATGQPAEQVLKVANERDIDLVAMGSRGRGPLRRTFLGSVSDQVARHAPATLIARRPLV